VKIGKGRKFAVYFSYFKNFSPNIKPFVPQTLDTFLMENHIFEYYFE
jgi:hypothetical protein